jgi:ACT domain-containing protein
MKINEELIRKITLSSMKELGNKADLDTLQKIVSKVIEKIEDEDGYEKNISMDKSFTSESGRLILTSYGKNQPGIVARITTILAEYNCDVQDLSQKILQEYFTMIMLVDISNCNISFSDLKEKLSEIANEMNIRIIVQHEDVFKYMHRV